MELPFEANLGFSMLNMDTLQTKCGEAKVRIWFLYLTKDYHNFSFKDSFCYLERFYKILNLLLAWREQTSKDMFFEKHCS